MDKTDPTVTSVVPAVPIPSGSVAVSLTPEDIADAAESRATTFARDTAAGVCVADGMGLVVRVQRGALVVEDGLGEHRRERRFDKATHGLSRLVVLGSAGYVTLDALHWCRRLGVGVIVLAPDGTASLASTPRLTDDARLRRVQAMAPDLPVGLDLARYLIGRKLAGQANVLRTHFGDEESAPLIDMLVDELDKVADLDDVRKIETLGAETYWSTWSGQSQAVPRFAAKDRRRVPSHWSTFRGRRSVLRSANGNRKAERPVNALLNYTYALLEAEAVLACTAVGLDAGLALIHQDARGRQSLALDLMEPVRPLVDAFVLDLLDRHTLRKVEFTETTDGHCRLKAPLTHELAESIPQWSRAVAPYAEHVAHALGQVMAGKYVAVTPLTTRRHRDAQASIKARKLAGSTRAKDSTARQRQPAKRSSAAWSCPDCGGSVTERHRVRCDACIDKDPRHTPTLRATRAAAISRRRQAEAAWVEATGGGSADPEEFVRTIMPRLQGVPLAAIVAACGVSKASASNWRTGRRRPHPSHWRSLTALVEA